MEWERRKPLWPRVIALGLLFVLALAAPYAWQNRDVVRSNDAPSVAPSPPFELDEELQLDLPTLPLVQSEPQEPESDRLSPSPSLEISLDPVTAPLPVRREFDLNTLLHVRDRLLALMDQMPAPRPEVSTAPSRSIPQAPAVRVTSENDRLAMVQPRSYSRGSSPASSEFGRRTYRNEREFAAELLESARNPEPLPAEPVHTPRLAMVPTPAEPQNKPEPIEAPIEPILEAPIEPILEVAKPPVTPSPLRHRPQALVKQLEEFSPGSPGALWSQQVLAALRQLTEEGIAERVDPTLRLDELEQLFEVAARQLEQADSATFDNQYLQATQALGRRLVLWRLLLRPEQPRVVESSPATVELLPVVEDVSERLNEASNGNDWSSYLLLDRIVELTSEGIESPTLARAKLAQEILTRMSDPQLTDAQLDFLASQEFDQLKQALRPWAAGRVNLETLAALIERYEAGRQNRYAELIAQLQQRLKWSDDPQMQALADHLDQHYRGANMRIAMSDFLMNRMLPPQEPSVSPVRDRVAGAKIRGQARTTTKLRVRLKPDPEAWHVTFEANGKVYSHTRSDTWPARIRNAARMQYQGQKDISISEQGVKLAPARATARGRNELVGVDSQLDPIPILGHLLRDMARKKHKKNRPKANSHAKTKVIRQVKERMDSGLAEKINAFEQKFRDKVLAPIEELALLAEPLDIHTTEKRAVMQLRLANDGQLAAHTVRPYAPSDSVLSVQMHETALNNAMMGLGLDGRRMTMLELFEFLTQRFGRSEATPPEDLPRRAIIQFAKRDAVRVQCEGDRLELILSVAQLSHRRDKIKNFEIHIHFRPQASGLSVRLVRDGTLQFSGRRLKTGPRVVLHSILGKVVPEEQEYTLVSPKLMLDSRFAGLMVTQLVLEDGWLGLAIGPAQARRTAVRAPMPKVLPTPFVR